MSNTQEEMMELLWAKEHDADAKIRAAVYGLLNATDMDSAFFRYYEIMSNAHTLLKLIYTEISTGYWDEEDEDDDTKRAEEN